jgi:hypothetical protein
VAVPSTLTAVAGDKATATAVNAGYRDPLNFSLDPPRVHAYDNTGLSCGDGSTILVTLSGEAYDTDSMHSTSSLTSRIVFTTAGLYELQLTVAWPNATYSVSDIMLRLNGAGAVGGGTLIRTQNYQTARVPTMLIQRFFNAADYVEFWVTQTSGGSRTTIAGTYATYVHARWVAIS